MNGAAGVPLLSLEGVGKDYAKVESRGGQVRLVWDLLRGHGAANVFRALDDISFTLERGQSRKRRLEIVACRAGQLGNPAARHGRGRGMAV